MSEFGPFFGLGPYHSLIYR